MLAILISRGYNAIFLKKIAYIILLIHLVMEYIPEIKASQFRKTAMLSWIKILKKLRIEI